MNRVEFMKFFATGTITPLISGVACSNTTPSKKPAEESSVEYAKSSSELSSASLPDHVFSSVAQLVASNVVPSSKIKYVTVLGFYEPGDGGDGKFYWNENLNKKNHNGGTIIDPDHIMSPDQSLENWLKPKNNANGCWVSTDQSHMKVKSFGASENEKTYNQVAIQKAIDELPDGGTLEFNGKSFTLQGSLFLQDKNNIVLKGSSSELVVDTEKFNGNYQLFFERSQNVRFTNINIYGQIEKNPTTKVRGIRLNNCQNIEISNCTFHNLDGGIIGNSQNNTLNTDITIANNKFTSTKNINAQERSGIQEGEGGIAIWTQAGAQKWFINDNYIYQAHIGILCGGRELQKNLMVTNNVIEDTGDSSIYLNGSGHIISNNIVKRAGKDGIKCTVQTKEVEDSQNNKITDNTVQYTGLKVKTGGLGIGMESSHGTISGNTIIQDDINHLATKGTIGILVRGSNVLVMENLLKCEANDQMTGIKIHADQADISGCVVNNNKINNCQNAINILQLKSFLISNLVIKNNAAETCKNFLRLKSDSIKKVQHLIIESNQIFDCSRNGILFVSNGQGAQNVRIKSNTFMNLKGVVFNLNNISKDVIIDGNSTDGKEKKFYEGVDAVYLNNLSGGSKVKTKH